MNHNFNKMIISLLLFLGLTFTFWDSIKGLEVNKMNMLVSFTTYDIRPTSILLPNSCWNLQDLKILSKHINKKGIFLSTSMQATRNSYNLHHLLIVVDFSCAGTSDFLIKANEEGFFKAPYRWLILSSEEDIKVLKELEIVIDSDVVLAVKAGDGYWLREVYKITQQSEIIYSTRLIWRSQSNRSIENYATRDYNNTDFDTSNNTKVVITETGAVIEDFRENKALAIRRSNLRGHHLTIAVVLAESNNTVYHLEDGLDRQHDVYSKISYAAAKVLFQMLNASEVRVFANTWGYKNKDGSWQGMVDLLIKKKADIGTICVFTKDRQQVTDFIAMLADTSLRFIFREPPLSYVSNIFALTFSSKVWIASFSCVIICSAFLYITVKWDLYINKKERITEADVLILALGAVLQQGCSQEPRNPAGRCVFFFLYIALTILFSAYSANIVVLLRAPSSSVRNLKDLLNSPLTLAANDIYYNKYFFQRLRDPLRKEIYDKKIAPKGLYYNVSFGVEKIRKGLFAFHSVVDPVHHEIQQTFQEHEKCDLVEMDYLNEIDPWLPVQRGSPFKDLFKISFYKYRETGLQKCNQRRIQAPRPRCSGQVSLFSSVGITDIYHVLLATIYGILLSVGILMIEIGFHRFTVARNR